MTSKDVLEMAKKNKVEIVDVRFCDFPGQWQHFSIPVAELSEGTFKEGLGFDGSSIRGFQTIDESDMLLMPDSNTAFLDPFTEHTTLNLICNIKDPVTGQSYSRDPRLVAQKAEAYLKDSGVADTSYWGPELEFYIFDNVRFNQTYNEGFYHVDSIEGFWNSGDGSQQNLGHKPRYKEGYFPVAPVDHYQDLRSEMVKQLEKAGIKVEVQHQVGTGGQAEIDMRFDTLTAMADKVLKYKYIVKNVAKQRGKTVTMMPKPLFMDNGTGMHTHQSLWKGGKNLFFNAKDSYALISDTARHYIGGILTHALALCAFIAPTTNSYRRLVPGYEAPINLAYSKRNRSACVRIPMYSKSEKAKRIEFRCPDPTANPYYAFSAMMMAGLDGIEKKIEPPAPLDKNIYDLEPEEKAKVKSVAGSLDEALDNLEKDHDFLLKGNVFTQDVIDTWLDYKRTNEIDAIRLRPHPYEFALYYDV